MFSVPCLTFFVLGLCLGASGQKFGVYKMNIEDSVSDPLDDVSKITVNLTSSLHVCQDKFLSICIDSGEVQRKWSQFDFSSPKLQNLAAALSPTNFRLGGTMADFLRFDPTATDEDLAVEESKSLESERDLSQYDSGYFGPDIGKDLKNYTMSGKMWDNMTFFFSAVGWDLMFDFNLFFWKDHGLWNSSNAELLLNYSAARGYRIPSFQLGNEPNSFRHNFNFSIGPDILLKDFKILKKLISKYPLYKDSGLYGPDVTNLDRHSSSRSYFQGFVDAGAADVVNEFSVHHYYLNGRIAKVYDFLEVKVLDSLRPEFEIAWNISRSSSKPLPIRLTETSSCYGGGAPGLSDAYVAGFLWLDKLGLSAQYGLSHVFRQTFFGGNYALISPTLDPNPDYYLSVLFKRLIEGPVFSVSVEPADPHLRVYAHCARRDKYPPGTLVLYYLNLRSKPAILSLSQFEGKDLDLYLLTPGDSQGLKSRFVKLNGQKLLMQGSLLPQLLPKPHKGDVTVDGQSFGFVVVPHVNVPLCMKYYQQKDSERQNFKG